MDQTSFREISYNSDEYHQILKLRNESLRLPLGLSIYDEDLEMDKSSMHICGHRDDSIVACCIITPLDEHTAKVRQVAVAEKHRKQGIGSKLLDYVDAICREKGFNTLVANVRKHAVDLYTKKNWTIISDEFMEVGIPHVKMSKSIA